MLANKIVGIKVSVDPDLYMLFTTNDVSRSDISRSFKRDIERMICPRHPELKTVDEMVNDYITYVAILSRLSVRDISSSEKIPTQCLIRLIQKNCGDWIDECFELMCVAEEDVPTGYISQYITLKNKFRDYVFNHIPEMVEIVKDFVVNH